MLGLNRYSESISYLFFQTLMFNVEMVVIHPYVEYNLGLSNILNLTS